MPNAGMHAHRSY